MSSSFTKQLLANKTNLVYASLIVATHFSYGIVANIFGPVLVDLRFIYNVSVDASSYFSVATQIGYLLGSLVGWLYRWLNRQLTLAFFILVMGLTSAAVPHFQSFGVAIAALVVNGIASGAWDSASGFWIVQIFTAGHADGMLQFIQFAYGGGSALAPLLAAPFVRGETMIDEAGRNITGTDRKHSLTLPFIITAIGPVTITTCLLILFIFRRYKPPTSDVTCNEKSEDTKLDATSIRHRNLKLGLCGVAIAAYATTELGWFNFSTSMYQYLELMDAPTAAHMQSIVLATYTLGRLTTAFITAKLQPDIIISYHYLTLMSGIATIFIGSTRNSHPIIITGSAIMGYGLSAMWPALLAWCELHLRLSDRVCSIYCFLSGLMSLVIPLTLGQTFNDHPMMLFALEGFFVSLSLAMFILVKLLIVRDTGKWL